MQGAAIWVRYPLCFSNVVYKLDTMAMVMLYEGWNDLIFKETNG